MKEEMMFKYAQIRNSYARKRFGTLTNEEKALIDYETFCLELIKENENLKSQLKAKEEELKYTIGIVEHNKIVSEKNKQIRQLKEVIKEARECVEELYDNTDDTTCYDIDKHRKIYLLEILSKGDNK